MEMFRVQDVGSRTSVVLRFDGDIPGSFEGLTGGCIGVLGFRG